MEAEVVKAVAALHVKVTRTHLTHDLIEHVQIKVPATEQTRTPAVSAASLAPHNVQIDVPHIPEAVIVANCLVAHFSSQCLPLVFQSRSLGWRLLRPSNSVRTKSGIWLPLMADRRAKRS